MNFFSNLKHGVLSLTCILIMTSMILSGCGQSSLYEDAPSDYETIYEVDGISFALPGNFLTAATAVTEITANSDFTEDGVYLYKDGESSYILFSMSQIVIVCEKGTRFDFTTTDDMAAALDNSSILGVWLDSTKKKGLDYTSANDGIAYKMIANVTAQVSMTTNLFGDFVGKLASVKTADDEWSLFVGIPGTSVSDIPSAQLKVINYVAKSVKVDSAAATETSYEYTDGDAESESTEDADTSNTASAENTSPAEDGQTSDSAAVNEENAADTGSTEDTRETDHDKTSDAIDASDESTDNEDAASASDAAGSDDSTVAATTDETGATDTKSATSTDTTAAGDTDATKSSSKKGSSAKKEEKVEDTTASDSAEKKTSHENESRPESGSSASISVSNQKTTKANKDGAKNSSIYSFLKVGEKGTLDALSEETTEAEEIAITLKATYKGQDAIDKIKAYIASGKAGYEYTEPPVGTLWEVAEYDIDYGQVTDSPYVDISLYGVDGTKIKKSGISYSSRTYDMNYLAKEDGTGYMVYYAVPLNCSEYVICAGMGNIENDFKAAYYLIK